MPSLPIEGWGVAATELEPSFPSWGEPDRVFLLRAERHWTLVTLSLARPLDDQGARLVGRSALSAETFASLDDVGEAPCATATSTRAGFACWTPASKPTQTSAAPGPTRVERDFDQASLHRRHLASGSPPPAGLVHADETDDADPVFGVVDVRRYGFEAPPSRGSTRRREVC